MARNAVVYTTTGSVLRYGFTDFTTDGSFNAATETQVSITDDTIPPDGVPLKYVKVVAGVFTEMTAPEKANVDALTPTNAVQRKIVSAETTVATGSTDATTGWASIIGGAVTARPLKAGDYQLVVAFELALTAAGIWAVAGPDRAAQARLLINGSEVATFINAFQYYDQRSVVLGDTFTEGSVLTIDLQIRRFGLLGSAKGRRIRMELAPTNSASSL